MTEPTLDERLAAARLAEEQANEAEAEVDKRRELLVYDLKAKGTLICTKGEVPGRLGRDFQVCVWPELDKVVLLKRAEAIVVKAYNQKVSSKAGAQDADVLQYVVPSVEYPTRDEFKAWVKDHSQMAFECALELRRLEGLRLEDKAGKR